MNLREPEFSICQNPDCLVSVEMGEELCQNCRERNLRVTVDARNKLYYLAHKEDTPEFPGYDTDDEFLRRMDKLEDRILRINGLTSQIERFGRFE